MGDFSGAWLTIREAADASARDRGLIRHMRGMFDQSGVIPVLDLGCGSGAQMRFLAPQLAGGQHWVLVDRDPGLLATLPDRLAAVCRRHAVAWTARHRDLDSDLGDLYRVASLVTASALLDLVSRDWLRRQCAGWIRFPPVLYFSLSFDGSLVWEPTDPDDTWIADCFNRHQIRDKGFGPALGAGAVDVFAAMLAAAGFGVATAPSPWHLDGGDRELQRSMVSGCGEAVAETGDPVRAAAWMRRRLQYINAGVSSLTVGHRDLLAWPQGGSRTGSRDPS